MDIVLVFAIQELGRSDRLGNFLCRRFLTLGQVSVPAQQRVEKLRLASAQIKTRIYGKNGEVPDRLFQLETLVPGQDEKQMSDWVAGAILASRKLPQFLTPMARGLPKTVRPGRLRMEV